MPFPMQLQPGPSRSSTPAKHDHAPLGVALGPSPSSESPLSDVTHPHLVCEDDDSPSRIVHPWAVYAYAHKGPQSGPRPWDPQPPFHGRPDVVRPVTRRSYERGLPLYTRALSESLTSEVGDFHHPSQDLVHHETLTRSRSPGPTFFYPTIVIPMAPETSPGELEARPWSNFDLEDNDFTPIFKCAWDGCEAKFQLGPGTRDTYSDHISGSHGTFVTDGVCPFDTCKRKTCPNLKTHLLNVHHGLAFICPFYSKCGQTITGDKTYVKQHLNKKHREERKRRLSLKITFLTEKVARRKRYESWEEGGTSPMVQVFQV
ncbi:hypothetical protein NLI96_g3728 [Meripilus lineatus]|uniref:C2H2-type domain-containing protein n=1 Tax=Meripilus lineatus TaxID=2056292 RepID=A0AAD5YIQ5_9APHY|nr:hypothetical protein NLI96_g3728 [Physisporinus lineatus]